MIAGGLSIDVAINALEEKGLARSLAEPNLVALSGDTASFLAGGEFPIPVPGSARHRRRSNTRVRRRPRLHPDRARDGLINLKIEPEVSELDHSHPVQIAGYSIPPLIVRRASTTVELRDGQSFVIGGLLQNKSTNRAAAAALARRRAGARRAVPQRGLSEERDRSRHHRHAAPRAAGRPGDAIKTPLDNTLPANDVDFFLMGKAEITPRRGAARGRPPAAVRRPHSRSAARRAPMSSRQELSVA